MTDRRLTAVLVNQFKTAVKEPHEYLKFCMDEKDVKTWYIMLSGFEGDEGEYKGGQYIVRVVLPNDFPYNPPQFYFMTEQGLYGVETKVCISIGEYHKDQYRAALGVRGFCNQLVSGLIGWKDMGSGIQILSTSNKEKSRLARASQAYNERHNADILRKINDSYNGYSAAWPKPDAVAEVATAITNKVITNSANNTNNTTVEKVEPTAEKVETTVDEITEKVANCTIDDLS